MDSQSNGNGNGHTETWITETGDLNFHKSISLSFKVDKLLHQETSPFQKITAFESETLGRCLMLDDLMQVTERDEHTYQEMMSLLPLTCHPCPRRVLIVGGGDGGVAREILKLPSIESVVLCEIDEAVVRVSEKYLPFTSCSFSNPKLEIRIGDGIAFVASCENEFDVIITDSSDPTGPGVGLFNNAYYMSLFRALKPGGIICSQAEGMWFELDIVKKLLQICNSIFACASYATIMVPTYPAGQIGCLIAHKDKVIDFSKPVIRLTPEHEASLRYYTRDIHAAAFALPKQIRDTLAFRKKTSFEGTRYIIRTEKYDHEASG